MIPSLDTYVYHEIERNLRAILGTPKVLEEILKGFDKKVRENFIKGYSFTASKGALKQVTLSYVFPEIKQDVSAMIVVQQGESRHDTGAIGDVMQTYEYRTGETFQQQAQIIEDPDDDTRLCVLLDHTIGTIHSYGNISFAKSDDVQIEGNKVSFVKAPNHELIDKYMFVTYESKEDLDEDPIGRKLGYATEDQIEVLPISSNIDIARCLDAILRAIMLMMEENIEEEIGFMIQTVHFGGMQNLLSNREQMDQVIYGRSITMNYKVNYTIDFDLGKIVKEFNLKEKNYGN